MRFDSNATVSPDRSSEHVNGRAHPIHETLLYGNFNGANVANVATRMDIRTGFVIMVMQG
jgi:sugar/nucleoside kinase (ribokinase family)